MLSFWRELFVIKFMSQFKFQIIFLPKFSTIFICFKLRIIIVGKGGQPPFSTNPPPSPTLRANQSSQDFPIKRNATEIKFNKYYPCKKLK